jgi:uncharacterized protein
MTMWGKFVRRRGLGDVQFERIPTPDGDEVTLASAATPVTGPILFLLHGLEGGVHSHYVSGIWEVARRNGWQPKLLLFRTCDGRTNSARRTYHSGETTDLDLIVRRAISQEPNRSVGLVGVSLGGNVLLKWLGEQGASVPRQVQSAMAISTPYDLARSSKAIDSGFARLYQWNFLRSLKRKALEKLVQYPDVGSTADVESLRTMWAFDDRFTAPLHGFRDAADYYRRSSSIHFLGQIQRPTLLLSALDDPFHTVEVLREVEAICALHPFVKAEFHERGGHVGFVGGAPWRPSYYVEARVESFLGDYLDAADSAD